MNKHVIITGKLTIYWVKILGIYRLEVYFCEVYITLAKWMKQQRTTLKTSWSKPKCLYWAWGGITSVAVPWSHGWVDGKLTSTTHTSPFISHSTNVLFSLHLYQRNIPHELSMSPQLEPFTQLSHYLLLHIWLFQSSTILNSYFMTVFM